MKREGFYYCIDCNKTFEYACIESEGLPKCTHPEHKRFKITDKQFLDFMSIKKIIPVDKIK